MLKKLNFFIASFMIASIISVVTLTDLSAKAKTPATVEKAIEEDSLKTTAVAKGGEITVSDTQLVAMVKITLTGPNDDVTDDVIALTEETVGTTKVQKLTDAMATSLSTYFKTNLTPAKLKEVKDKKLDDLTENKAKMAQMFISSADLGEISKFMGANAAAAIKDVKIASGGCQKQTTDKSFTCVVTFTYSSK